MSGRRLAALGSLLVLVVATAVGCGQTGERSERPGTASGSSGTPSATVSSTAGSSTAGRSTDPESGLPWIAVSALPPEAQHELDLIEAGGPFRYPGKDGSTFGNFEGILPDEARGYYHEYTVDTPGSPDRGARRIITGDGGEYYYTADHYATFSRIQ